MDSVVYFTQEFLCILTSETIMFHDPAQSKTSPLFINSEHPTLLKKKENFPHILGISEGIGCKAIYEEGLPLYEEMRKYLVIYRYDFASDPFLIALYMREIFFSFFNSVQPSVSHSIGCAMLHVQYVWTWHSYVRCHRCKENPIYVFLFWE